MNLYIMSRGRAGKVATAKWIPWKYRVQTAIVVPEAEAVLYRQANPGLRVVPAPEKVTNYSEKFQYLLDLDDGNKKAVILDDDLVFSDRSDPYRVNSLITIREPEKLQDLFDRMCSLLDEYTLVGVHPRQMGQNAARPYVLNGRIICIQGINREKIGHVKVDQFPILADVVLSCTLLARGQPNALITTTFQDHGPCQAPGGCSIYRTPEMQRSAVQYLVQRFPGFVKMVERRPKVAKWMGDVRYDYTCQWKKLYEAGVEWKEGKGPCPDMEIVEPTYEVIES